MSEGFFVSDEGKKYNIIILASGKGTRMGGSSDYIPKPMVKIGKERAISYIINKYSLIAHKIIVVVCWQADIFSTFLYQFPHVCTVVEPELVSIGNSLFYGLEKADADYPTIVSYADYIFMGKYILPHNQDFFMAATKETKGNIGTFRHRFDEERNLFWSFLSPQCLFNYTGVLGWFHFSDTVLLKSIAYRLKWIKKLNDVIDVVRIYNTKKHIIPLICDYVLDFGTEDDLEKVRKIWERT